MSAGEADSDFEPLPFLPAGWGFQDDDSIIFDDQQQVLQHDKDGPSPSQQQTLNGYSFPSSDPEDLDKMLAAELTKLSVEERDQILFDLHGVADDMEETPELIEQSLSRMDQCLTTMTEHDSEDLTIAYQEALAQSPSYVRDEAFRTRFLRTERFEPDEAAKRYCKFFGVKKQLFGSEFLTKEIRIHDLSAKEQAALRSGVFQLLPIKDHAGRTVLLHIDVLTGDSDITSMVKAAFYITTAASEDIDNQRRGLVIVIMSLERGFTDISQAQREMDGMKILHGATVIRNDALHNCYDRPEKKGLARVVTVMHGTHVRIRARHHEGPIDKIKLELMSFGIPCSPDVFPIINDKEIDLTHHKIWCDRRAKLDLEAEPRSPNKHQDRTEKQPSPGDVIEIPSPKDILIGRSALCQNHVGNVKYTSEIHSQLPRYNVATLRKEKSAVANDVVQKMKAAGCRFLNERTDGTFVLLTDEEAREKIKTAFRDRRKHIVCSGTSNI